MLIKLKLFPLSSRSCSVNGATGAGKVKTTLIFMGVIIGLILATGIGLYFYSPAMLVDRIDRIASRNTILNTGEYIRFDNVGNRLDIWDSPVKSATPKPVLVFFYGGGWAHGTRTEYLYAARPFVEAGYIVVLPDYRKVPDVRFPGFVQDSAAAVKWVQANISKFGGDPERVSVAGHSAGAYNALMLALDKQWLGDKPVKAAISLAGPADFFPFTTDRSKAAMGQWADPAETQPISFVRADAPPILLIHGSADTTVRIRNANSLLAKQKAAGGDIQLAAYEGASHNDLVLALGTLFRRRHPVVADSVRFLDRVNGVGEKR
jgi:acetyl esterase/lipase